MKPPAPAPLAADSAGLHDEGADVFDLEFTVDSEGRRKPLAQMTTEELRFARLQAMLAARQAHALARFFGQLAEARAAEEDAVAVPGRRLRAVR